MDNIDNIKKTENENDVVSDLYVEVDDIIYDYKSPDHKPPFQTDYCEMDVSQLDDEVIRLTVGKNGSNFTKITEGNKIAWIFHNKQTNKIEIWGKKEKLNKVKHQINNHIEWSKKYIQNRNN